MINAEEMFKDLGFSLDAFNPNFTEVAYCHICDDYRESISVCFDNDKTYRVIGSYCFTDNFAANVTPELHKAITKKMEELGWL